MKAMAPTLLCVLLVAGVPARAGALTELQITSEIATDQQPNWSSDDTELAFGSNRSGADDIWIVPSTGGTPTPLTTSPLVQRQPDWAPDGSLIAFSAPSSGGAPGDLWTIPPTGGTPTLLEGSVLTDDRLPAWSPDGTRIAYTRDNDIYVIPSGGGTPARITTDGAVDLHPTWSPDGTRLAFMSMRSGNGDIWTIAATGGAATQITTEPGSDKSPDWSPDGANIIFQSNRAGGSDIWVIPSTGGAATALTADPMIDVQPDYSRTGHRIAFSRGGNIWTLTLPIADLSVTKSTDNGTPAIADSVTFTVTISNAGPQDAATVQVTDALPAGMTFVSAGTSQGSYDSGSGTWAVGGVAALDSATLTLTATVDAGAGGLTLTNTAALTGYTGTVADTVTVNNTATAEIIVQGLLAISSADDQVFLNAAPSTAISPITVTEDATSPTITASNDLRVRVPAGFIMIWDASDATATVTGPAAAKVSGTVTFEDAGATVVLDVLTDFAANDRITIAGLSFTGFGVSRPDNLRLEVNNDGAVSAADDKEIQVVSATSVVATNVTPGTFSLEMARPNPFLDVTQIRFEVPVAGPADLTVYDTAGRLVRRLHRGIIAAGHHTTYWDGSDSNGRRVAAGVYFVKLTSGSFRETRKTVLLR